MIPNAPDLYSRTDQQAMRAEIRRALGRLVMKNGDFEPEPGRIILRSPDGTRFVISVADDGTLSATAL